MPKISVIMPIYNTKPEYLRKAISSILNQTFTDFEFLILNDSPKNLQLDKEVENFHDERIKYTKSEQNLGIAEAHNRLLKMATGKYIAIMDHDDISLPTRLEKQYLYMESHEEVGICGTAYKRFGKPSKIKTVRHPQEHKMIQASLLFHCPIHHPTAMIRRNILTRFNITYDKRFISLNDRKLYLDISRHAELHNLPNILYKYRMHPLMTSCIRRQEIMNEQLQYRESLLKKYGIQLTPEEHEILNNYVFNGRCRINFSDLLNRINHILECLVKENKRHPFADEKSLKTVCACYLIKRCKNAALKGFISSKNILNKTTLPVHCPWWLTVFNRLKA
ncbi:MAG: glycosyltransferase [Alphaproteobacteria bacterium]|nr:glycosyltransferase [Alphaproteobacteria bacterium]